MARTLYSFTAFSFVPTTGTFPDSVEYHTAEHRKALAYDASAVEIAAVDFVAPQGLVTPLTVVLTFAMAAATTGNVVLGAAIEAVSDGDSLDLDSATSFDTNNASAATAVPATAGFPKQVSITLTNNDSIAAGDKCRLRIQRDGAAGTDTAAGDLYLTDVELRDSG